MIEDGILGLSSIACGRPFGQSDRRKLPEVAWPAAVNVRRRAPQIRTQKAKTFRLISRFTANGNAKLLDEVQI
jgi:hypothetical protein